MIGKFNGSTEGSADVVEPTAGLEVDFLEEEEIIGGGHLKYFLKIHQRPTVAKKRVEEQEER
jgi:hypothetical protein